MTDPNENNDLMSSHEVNLNFLLDFIDRFIALVWNKITFLTKRRLKQSIKLNPYLKGITISSFGLKTRDLIVQELKRRVDETASPIRQDYTITPFFTTFTRLLNTIFIKASQKIELVELYKMFQTCYETVYKQYISMGLRPEILNYFPSPIVNVIRVKIDELKAKEDAITERERAEELESANLYIKNIIASMIDMLIVLDDKGLITEANKSVIDQLGFPKKELIGKHISIILEEEEEEEKKEDIKFSTRGRSTTRGKEIEKLINKGQIVNLERTYKTKSGKRIPVSFSGSIMKHKKGRVQGFVCVAQDKTDQKKAELEIKKISRLPDENPNPTLRITNNGKILYANKSSSRILNNWNCSINETIPHNIKTFVKKVYKTDEVLEIEVDYGNTYLLFTGAPIKDLGYVNLYGMDITKLKQEEEKRKKLETLAAVALTEKKRAKELNQKNKALNEANQELKEFSYITSHDLQEPLRTVTSIVDIFTKQYKKQLDNNADKYLYYISQATTRMGALIKALLDHSRLGHGKKLTSVNCNAIIRDIQNDLKSLIVETNTSISTAQLPQLKAYKTEFNLLFQNLITNAIKFRKPNTSPEIKITANKHNGHWKFCFQDNGIGISDKHKEKIFVIFKRLHSKKEYEGTGIGLAHCKKIVKLHHGDIWVDSKLGEGSKFYFTVKTKH